MNHPLDIADLSRKLGITISHAVCSETEGSDPHLFHISDIRRIAAQAVSEQLSSVSDSDRLVLLSSIGNWPAASPAMASVRFSLGEHVEEVLRAELDSRLGPLLDVLAMDHYEGRLSEILIGAKEVAAELIDGPAARCMKRDGYQSYAATLEQVLHDGSAPAHAELDIMLNQACDFFSPLDLCLEKPEWGEPVGISERSVGRTAAEIRSWFETVADLEALHKRRPEQFIETLGRELSTLSVTCAP